MNEIEIPALFDAHVHLRQGGMTARVAPYSGRVCDAVIAMPNTTPPVHHPSQIKWHRKHYEEHLGSGCRCLMTAKWLSDTAPCDVVAAKEAGAVGFKLYPRGMTTNAEDGIDPAQLLDDRHRAVLAELERQGMVLLCHGEWPGFVMDRERDFLPTFRAIARNYPQLRLTLEHVTTGHGVDLVQHLHRSGHQVLGTITLHHLVTTLDDVVGGKLRPDLFCKPIPKTPHDREMLLHAAKSGLPCFALGSDSAPHEPVAKYCREGCAGVFTAPVLAEWLVGIFEQMGYLDRLKAFTSANAMNFYGVRHSGRKIRLVNEPWEVPDQFGGVAVFGGGKTLEWKLED